MLNIVYTSSMTEAPALTSKRKDPDAVRLGSWLKDIRLSFGMSRPAFVQWLAKAVPNSQPVTKEYLAQVEDGWRSLARADDMRETIRLALGKSPSEWERETGLKVPPDIAQTGVMDVQAYGNARELFLDLPPSKTAEITARQAAKMQQYAGVSANELFAFQVERTLYIAKDVPTMRGQLLFVARKFITPAIDVYLYRCPELQTIILALPPEETKILHKNEKLEITRLEPSHKTMILPADYTLEFIGSTIGALTTSW